jgi:hypothetical protein
MRPAEQINVVAHDRRREGSSRIIDAAGRRHRSPPELMPAPDTV